VVGQKFDQDTYGSSTTVVESPPETSPIVTDEVPSKNLVEVPTIMFQ